MAEALHRGLLHGVVGVAPGEAGGCLVTLAGDGVVQTGPSGKVRTPDWYNLCVPTMLPCIFRKPHDRIMSQAKTVDEQAVQGHACTAQCSRAARAG